MERWVPSGNPLLSGFHTHMTQMLPDGCQRNLSKISGHHLALGTGNIHHKNSLLGQLFVRSSKNWRETGRTTFQEDEKVKVREGKAGRTRVWSKLSLSIK
jgi:hypothetical protein